MKFNFKVNKSSIQRFTDTLKRKVLSLTSSEFRQDCGHIYAEMIEPYVPKDTGRLRNSYTVDNTGKIRYNTSYAKRVYEVPARHYTTPGTTHHWDTYANPIIMDEYMAAINKLARDYMSRTK